MNPTPGPGTHAHSTNDGPQARAQHRGPGAGRPTAETRNPPHETVRRPGGSEWESGTDRDRGRNLTSMAERYPETACAAP